ncbi:MAG: hypothetical protein GY820_06485 [Gammaproteobacteria bacterium]|nr:hypothetical protein [Gammaproteobacteria bacterium]
MRIHRDRSIQYIEICIFARITGEKGGKEGDMVNMAKRQDGQHFGTTSHARTHNKIVEHDESSQILL